MGASLIGGGATFRYWAPNATSLHVRGSFNNFEIRDDAALIRGPAGHWHGFIPGVANRDLYKLWINGPAGPEFKRDPYARELEGPGWDCVIRSSDFPWHNTGFQTPEFHNLVIYQLHVGAFYSRREAKRPGTFLDVMDKIPYLDDLGVTALQLLPIQEFPGDFSMGYNGVDYFSPEMAYAVEDAELGPYLARANELLLAKQLAPYPQEALRGEMNQLKALVDICHAYGLAVIFDLVYNHAGGDFGKESLWFLDRQLGMEEPRWWNSLYFSDRTWAGGVVFNFQSDPVRDFLISNAAFLLDEYRADGFRFDEISVLDRNSYGRGWDFCQALTGTLRARAPRALLHAEYWDVNPWVIQETDEGGAGFHTTMTDGPRKALREVLSSASYPGAHPLPLTSLASQLGLDYLRARWRGVNSLENHDLVMQPKDETDHERLPRMVSVADPSAHRSWYARSRSRVATGLLLTMPGIPMLFMGQEFLEDKPWTDSVDKYPELRLYWDGLQAEDRSMSDFLRFTRELIELRWRYAALRAEGFAVVHVHDENRVLAFQRWVPGEGGDVLVVASFANETKYNYRIGFPGGGSWREVFNSDTYDHWVNPWRQGNGDGAQADGPPWQNLPNSASLTLPANSLLVFAR
jgi:1,4-alpha-glucan branching enzyme